MCMHHQETACEKLGNSCDMSGDAPKQLSEPDAADPCAYPVEQADGVSTAVSETYGYTFCVNVCKAGRCFCWRHCRAARAVRRGGRRARRVDGEARRAAWNAANLAILSSALARCRARHACVLRSWQARRSSSSACDRPAVALGGR